MTPERAINAALDAQALNAQQARLAYDPSPAVDSIVEHLLVAARLTTGEARTHVLEAATGIARLLDSNRAERDCERVVAGWLDGVRRSWTVKSAAATLRPALATIANPIIVGERHVEALKVVYEFVVSAPAELLLPSKASLRHELGVKKFSLLHELIADYRSQTVAA